MYVYTTMLHSALSQEFITRDSITQDRKNKFMINFLFIFFDQQTLTKG